MTLPTMYSDAMSQYFTLVNATRGEYVSLPGSLTVKGRLTNGPAMAVLGYLLLEGPNDGTSLTRTVADDAPGMAAMRDEIKERERESEERMFTSYHDEKPSYIVNQFERAHDISPELAPDKFEQFCRDKATSSYRDESGEWDEADLNRIAASHLEIKDTHQFAGRWAGCAVALTGDYSEREWYDKTKTHTLVKFENGETGRVTGVRELTDENGDKAFSTPISVDEIPRADEPGDYLEVSAAQHDCGDEPLVGKVLEIQPPEWDNITDGVFDEIENYMTDYMTGDNQDTVLEPDMVMTSE